LFISSTKYQEIDKEFRLMIALEVSEAISRFCKSNYQSNDRLKRRALSCQELAGKNAQES
jgi:hypothetical protein